MLDHRLSSRMAQLAAIIAIFGAGVAQAQTPAPEATPAPASPAPVAAAPARPFRVHLIERTAPCGLGSSDT